MSKVSSYLTIVHDWLRNFSLAHDCLERNRIMVENLKLIALHLQIYFIPFVSSIFSVYLLYNSSALIYNRHSTSLSKKLLNAKVLIHQLEMRAERRRRKIMAKLLIENYSFKIGKLRKWKSHFECSDEIGSFPRWVFVDFSGQMKKVFVMEILIKFQ